MKKLLCIIIFVINIISLRCFAEFENPFTDQDYLRDDFGIRSYRQYVTTSIDSRGMSWPEGTKIIAGETGHMGMNVGREDPARIPDTVEILGHYAFTDRRITDDMVNFEKLTRLKFIDAYAFAGTSVNRVDLSNTKVVRIGEQAFEQSGITTFIAPSTLKKIGDNMAPYCSLGTIRLNEGLEYIGANAFRGASDINTVIPSTVSFIGSNAFNHRVTLSVYKGSYAEKWCKDNGYSYTVINATEPSDSLGSDNDDIKKNIGPLKFTKYYSHTFSSNKLVSNNLRLPVMRVYIPSGGSIETIYDKVELYLVTPEWDINSPYTLTTGKNAIDYWQRPVALKDEFVTAIPSSGLDYGWSKGLRWIFDKSKTEYRVVVGFQGKLFYYIISTGYEEDYLKVKNQGAEPYINKNTITQKSSSVKIISDGKEYECEAYNIYGNNYFKLRDLAFMINGSGKQFSVGYREKERAVEIVRGNQYIPAGGELLAGDGIERPAHYYNPMPVFFEGYEVFLEMYNILGNNYIKLRDVAKLIDFNVSWSDTDRCIIIDTASAYAE